jgi:hyaluronan synthase
MKALVDIIFITKMNTHISKKEYLIADQLITGKVIKSANVLLKNSILTILLIITLTTAIWLKTRTLGEFTGDYILIGYAILITFFQLFRLTSALFYSKSLAKINSDLPANIRSQKYEPTVTCVIPCKNEEDAIHKTITKCFEADYPKDKLEVIVINDGSTDRTGEILAKLKQTTFPDLKIIDWEKNRGKRQAMNAGFKLSSGDIILQLDSDSYIIPNTFRNLIEPFKNPTVGAVCAHADPENSEESWVSKMQAAYYFMAFRVLKAAESTFGMVFCCSGCSSAYRRETVLPVLDSWLSESFMGKPVVWGDDRALTSYVIKNGYKTIYTDKAKALTIVPATFKRLIIQQVRWKKSWVINAILTGKFIWKIDPFVAFIYYYPLILLSILTPIMAFRALLYIPFFGNLSSLWFYLFGGLLITGILVLFCKFVSKEYKHWPYLFLWSIFNIFILSFLLFYSVATIQNRTWGTR